ncbi:MAG: hypothetical protein HOE53_00085 [Candidatus Magasanikbacteria bacterium]|jgi:hypothetical protein|nr:hypothetical protein [Candidatus Magasanikbacteria bacterium]
MLFKVLNKLAAEEKKKTGTPKPGYMPPAHGKQHGFHSKGSSTTGAARLRSIGNRMYKPTTKATS